MLSVWPLSRLLVVRGHKLADLDMYNDVRNASQSNDELMQHIGLVKRVALHLKTRLPNFMELEELIQVGTIGLIEAAKSFDDSKGVDFEVFARTRIRGAILDQVRKLSYLPQCTCRWRVKIKRHTPLQDAPNQRKQTTRPDRKPSGNTQHHHTRILQGRRAGAKFETGA